jgi:hypothetical protein
MHDINCTCCKYMLCNKQLQSYLVVFLGLAHTTENKSICGNSKSDLNILKVPAFEEAKVAYILMYLYSAVSKAKRMTTPYQERR